jgi:hypothetical protein
MEGSGAFLASFLGCVFACCKSSNEQMGHKKESQQCGYCPYHRGKSLAISTPAIYVKNLVSFCRSGAAHQGLMLEAAHRRTLEKTHEYSIFKAFQLEQNYPDLATQTFKKIDFNRCYTHSDSSAGFFLFYKSPAAMLNMNCPSSVRHG